MARPGDGSPMTVVLPFSKIVPTSSLRSAAYKSTALLSAQSLFFQNAASTYSLPTTRTFRVVGAGPSIFASQGVFALAPSALT